MTQTLLGGTSTREAHPRFPVLDSLRALAALGVLTTHVAFQTGNYLGHGIWGGLLARLDVGVAVFFVLSGFLLCRPYLARARDGHPHPGIRAYYLKRLLRIYPVYAVTVVLALTLMPGDRAGPGQWLRTLLLADVFTRQGKLPDGLTQMWSLSVEATFYLLLPLLMLVLLPRRGGLRPRRVVIGLVVLLALSCWWHLWLADRLEPVTSGAPTLWLPAFATWFAVGIGLALAHVLAEVSPRPPVLVRGLQALGGQPGVCATVVLGLMLVVATPVGGPVQLVVATSAESTTKHLVYGLVGALVVLTGVFPAERSRYARALSARLPRHLGLTSYSLFCLHLPILSLVLAVTGTRVFDGHGLRVWVLTVLVSVAAAEVVYRLVERPGMRLSGLSRRRPGSGRNSAATPTTTR